MNLSNGRDQKKRTFLLVNKLISGLKRLKNAAVLYFRAGQLSRAIRKKPEDLDYLITTVQRFNSFRMSQQRVEIKALLELIKEKKPKTICEIGSYRGGTFCCFCQVAPLDSIIVSVDILYPVERQLAHRRFARPSQKVRFIQGDSHSLKTLAEVKNSFQGEFIDFMFLDGDHSYDGVKKDFEMYADLVKPGGIIAFHDIYPDNFLRTGVKTASYVGGVPKFWREIKNRYSMAMEIIEEDGQDGFGLGILSSKKSTSPLFGETGCIEKI